MSIENLQGQISRYRQVLEEKVEHVEHNVYPILIGIRESYLEPIHAMRQFVASGDSRSTAIIKATGYFAILSPGTLLTLVGILKGDPVIAAAGIGAFGVHGWICRNMRMGR